MRHPIPRPRTAARRGFLSSSSWLATALALCGPAQAQTEAPASGALNEVFVTATARPEDRSRIAATTQTIDQDTIARSSARSVTDLLAENAVGFLSEWTAAQTSMNIRGAATDGQGRDFRSQVLVLVNGRRAGTANLSKLSPSDVERIEIVRGPGSVVYGSQNMGGVVNIIMKTGATQPGSSVDLTAGSWGLWRAHAQTAGASNKFDWYIGFSGGARDDYDSGKGGTTMANTGWERRGASGALGWQLADHHRVQLQLRTDGIYNAGFRGSGANVHSRDNRDNRSLDLTYEGATADQRVRWMAQAYDLSDVDEFNWASPVVRSGTAAVPGTSRDYNKRTLDVSGLRLQPRFKLGQGNDLLLGLDWEKSRLRSNRERVALPGGPSGQVAPYDNNQTEEVHALYFEDAQTLLDDRLTLRAGLRKTWGQTRFDATPNLPLAVSTTRKYDTHTWSMGATWKASELLNLRAGASTGFRAPTATELASDFTAVGGGRIFGNANLKPETSRQIEVGATLQAAGWRLDTALFQNTISDRITTVSRGPTTNTSDYANNAADIVARGIEFNGNLDLARALQLRGRVLDAFASGYYHFDMRDKGAAATLNTDKVQRMYRYEGSAGVRYGQGGARDAGAWTVQIAALLRGPMWYDTEENLLIPQGEPSSTFIHRKGAFTVWNLRADVRVSPGVKLYAGVNNLFDLNRHPIFIALDRSPCTANAAFQNGGCGTSMPGRELLVGLHVDF
ncbi:TonB-dependent receptor [Pseudorhodoferax sp. LjRoot39]|uniref:TonB-dependent receptor n=1 Tax=Pseudorhodoferax sp. LjRoot39 TaxID=3342328 RepID=UPI003ECEA5D7